MLEGDLQRHFHGRGTRIREEDLVELRLVVESRRPPDQLGGQLDRRWRGQPQQRAVRDLLQLQADGAVDLRLAVSVYVHPERRDAVQVLASQRVEEPRAAGVIDDDGLVAFRRREPVLHLRERMPDVRAVEREEPLMPPLRILHGGGDVLTHARCIDA